jgi:F420-non-reducing hydrogenase iron-sulfur subunit
LETEGFFSNDFERYVSKTQGMEKSSEKGNNVPKIAILYCQHSILRNTDIQSAINRELPCTVQPAEMPCSSRVQLPHLLKILDEGCDGVEIVACPEEGCRFLVGSRRAEKRVLHGRALLERIGVGGARLGITFASGLSGEALVDLAVKRGKAISLLANEGMNP